MQKMQSLSTALGRLISSLGPAQAKALRIAQNNNLFEQGVLMTWKDNPTAANFVLAHTNCLYFTEDSSPKKGAGKHDCPFILNVYMDDATAKAELNARRELLTMILNQNGLRFSELKILTATRDMKQRRLFPKAQEAISSSLRSKQCSLSNVDAQSNPASMPPFANNSQNEPINPHQIELLSSSIENPEVAQAFKKALESQRSS